jgi:hypothetical protein
MVQATGFVCVSYWRDKTCHVPPYKGTFQYEHFDTLDDAHECLREYEAGEWTGAEAKGVFACVDGMPVGGRVL